MHLVHLSHVHHCRREGLAAPLCDPYLWTAIPPDRLDTLEMAPRALMSTAAPAQPTCPRSPRGRTRSSTGSSHPRASGYRGQIPLTSPAPLGPRRPPFTTSPRETANTLWGKQINRGMKVKEWALDIVEHGGVKFVTGMYSSVRLPNLSYGMWLL